MVEDAFQEPEKRVMVSRTFHIEKKQINPMKSSASALGISQSELVRRSINLFISGYRDSRRKNSKKR
jgi:hypothetical protein